MSALRGAIAAPLTPPAPAPAQRRLRAELVISIATLLLVAGLLGFEVWKYYQPGWDGLAGQVMTSMNDYLSSDEQLSRTGAEVTHVTVMHAAENMFEGQATVGADSGKVRDVPVHIVFDGTSMFWRTDPGAFLFALS